MEIAGRYLWRLSLQSGLLWTCRDGIHDLKPCLVFSTAGPAVQQHSDIT